MRSANEVPPRNATNCVSLTTRGACEWFRIEIISRTSSPLRPAGTSFAIWPHKTLRASARDSGTAIRQEMAELERQRVAGKVDDETFDRREEELLERLLEAREYRRQQDEQQHT